METPQTHLLTGTTTFPCTFFSRGGASDLQSPDFVKIAVRFAITERAHFFRPGACFTSPQWSVEYPCNCVISLPCLNGFCSRHFVQHNTRTQVARYYCCITTLLNMHQTERVRDRASRWNSPLARLMTNSMGKKVTHRQTWRKFCGLWSLAPPNFVTLVITTVAVKCTHGGW
jgi:hypothetical protein